jgi:hypothetical protein
VKILYVYNFAYLDYQSDTVYHGLIDSGMDVYETHYPSYMLNGFVFDKQSMYGDVWQDIYGGLPGTTFTLYGKLDYTPKVESGEIIIDKIKSKFYDIVIYGCVYDHDGMPRRKCLDYLDEVIKYYSKHEIHFIDGSDNSWNYAHSNGLAPYGTIWKTQLESIGAGNPICFGIPESQLIKSNPKKEKLFADIIPGIKKTYVYSDEESYYNDYAKSYYGMTWKKGQWNCMRHLEILANKCIPYFPDIEDCPPFVMMDFPKEVFRETNKYARKYEIHPNYEWINDYIFDYTKNNLTTKKIVERFFRK